MHLPSIFGSKKFINKHLDKIDESYVYSVSADVNRTKPIPHKDVILDSVISYFQITENELYEAIKGKKNVPKMISIYLLSEVGQLSHKSISKIFPTLKQGSIASQIMRLKKLMSSSMFIDEQISEIMTKW